MYLGVVDRLGLSPCVADMTWKCAKRSLNSSTENLAKVYCETNRYNVY